MRGLSPLALLLTGRGVGRPFEKNAAGIWRKIEITSGGNQHLERKDLNFDLVLYLCAYIFFLQNFIEIRSGGNQHLEEEKNNFNLVLDLCAFFIFKSL